VTSAQDTGPGIYRLSPEAARDLEALGEGLRAVGQGERELTIEASTTGPFATLALVANRMIEGLSESEGRCGVAWKDHRDLLAEMAHDLRTPLTSLRVLAEAIDDEHDPDEARRYARQLVGHVASLEMLVRDIFELSRIQAGDRSWSLQSVRLEELIVESVEAMAGQAAQKSVGLRVPPIEVLPPAMATPEKIQRVLFNLISNAIRHTPRGGLITVEAELRGDSIEVEVADDGEGVDPSDREHLFESFRTGGSEPDPGNVRAGLGLTICRAIVEAHDGTIWFGDSKMGTRVRFSLQVASGAGVAADGPAVSARS